MKIDFSQKLLDLSGKPMEREKGHDATLSSVCVEALLLPREEDKGLPMADKLKRGRLAEKLYLKDDASPATIDVTVEEVNLMQSLIAKSYGTLVVMRAYDLLEGGTKE